MIQRRKDYAKKAPSKEASKIYIVCEGKETEKGYFEFFEGLSSNLKLIIIPPEDGTDPLKLMALAKKLLLSETGRFTLDFRQHDQVWFAIDTDTWEKEGKIQPLRDFCTMQNAIIGKFDEIKPYNAWNVTQSNPAFEIWLYYHFYDAPPSVEDTEEYPSIKAYVHNKIEGGFNYQKDPVRIKDAIENSEKNFTRQENGNPSLFSTEQHILCREILGFVSAEISKLRNKMG